ncbi:tRNA pseudouridine38-40 synthase [Pseudochelatococcus lubricantis]|uniref:tRNA pseudouridine synthase A n=1 Tax=Pseudochelatococcus lubricantis TaxID=1538102 RepID=A0ABX0V5H6_9HYPH|nr:tRNA pseudouridine(38-40) synthase TruA [Pseudochelatococcus lubricantis]NIJ59349.1 tRNA pseudouridine38-40 synthase [Pseudochelatococcus lubricantis]
MPRYRLIVEYDGTPYVGWQWQDNGRAVQQAVEEAIAACTNERMRVQCAGRTDAGVHATHQVVHVDLARDWRADRLRDAVNAHLKLQGDTVAVVAADAVDEAFDARHSAIRRHYLYRILNRRPQPALERNRVWHVPRQLDAPAMHEAAQRLVGKHDFTTFRAADCQAASPLRTLERLDVERTGDEIRIFAAARSFLHHQVRSMAGTLELVGAGKWTPDDVTDALEARQRARCGTMAPACGLYLIGVDYP